MTERQWAFLWLVIVSLLLQSLYLTQRVESFHSAVKVLWIAENVIQTSHGVFATDTLENTVNHDVVIVDVLPALIRNRLCREVEDDTEV